MKFLRKLIYINLTSMRTYVPFVRLFRGVKMDIAVGFSTRKTTNELISKMGPPWLKGDTFSWISIIPSNQVSPPVAKSAVLFLKSCLLETKEEKQCFLTIVAAWMLFWWCFSNPLDFLIDVCTNSFYQWRYLQNDRKETLNRFTHNQKPHHANALKV